VWRVLPLIVWRGIPLIAWRGLSCGGSYL
jgi:hypothetical protein